MHRRKLKIRIISFVFLAAAGFILYKLGRSLVIITKVLPTHQVQTAGQANEFSTVTYTSVDKNDNKFTLTSSKVTETDKNTIDFKDVITTFKVSPTETATILAKTSHLVFKDSKKCLLKGSVKLSTEEGLLLETEESIVDLDNQITKGHLPISLTQDDTKLSSNYYYFDLKHKQLTLSNHVRGTISGDTIITDKLYVEFNKVIGKDFKKIQAFGNSYYKTPQYEIKSNKSITYTNNLAEAVGNVALNVINRSHRYHINAYTISISLSNNIVQRITAKGKIKIKTQNNEIITGNHGVLENDILTVTDNVTIITKKGNILCKKAELNTKTNSIKLYQSKGIITK